MKRKSITMILAFMLVFSCCLSLGSADAYAASKPGKVSGLKGTLSGTSVSLTWKKVKGAKGYGIFCNDNYIATVKKPGFSEGNLSYDASYTYTVKAYKKTKTKYYNSAKKKWVNKKPKKKQWVGKKKKKTYLYGKGASVTLRTVQAPQGTVSLHLYHENEFFDGLPYTFKGIKYTFYAPDKITEIKTVEIGADGNSGAISLAPGTYYINMTGSNLYYAFNDKQLIPVEVRSGSSQTINIKEQPNTYPLSLELWVIPTDNSTVPEDTAYLKHIWFTLTPQASGLGPVTISAGQRIDYFTGKTTDLDDVTDFGFDNLPLGTYILTENQATLTDAENAVTETRGHFDRDLSQKSAVVKVTTAGAIMEVEGGTSCTFDNYWVTDAQLNLKVTNVMSDGSEPGGWDFNLYKDEACTELVGSATSDSTGVALFEDLPEQGTYWVKEMTASQFYKPKTNPISVKVKKTAYNTEVVDCVPISTSEATFNMEEKFINIKVQVIDSVTEEPINNREFTLYDSEGEVIAAIKTRGYHGQDGIAYFDGKKYKIKAGEYSLSYTDSSYTDYRRVSWSEQSPFTLNGDEGEKVITARMIPAS